MAQAAAAIEQERGFWIQAGLYPNPQAGYLRTDSSQPGQTQSNGAFISQEFVTAGKRQLSRAVESQEIRRLSWEQRAQIMRVLNDLQIRYLEVLGAQRAIAVSLDLVRVADDGLAATEEMLKLKQAARADVLQARLQRDTVRQGLQDAQYRHEAAWRQLVTIVGRPDLAPVELHGDLGGGIPDIDFESKLAELFAASPQVRAAEAELSHAQAEFNRERAARIPNVTLQTVTEYDRAAQSTNVTTLLAAPVPVFNRNQGNIYHAQADSARFRPLCHHRGNVRRHSSRSAYSQQKQLCGLEHLATLTRTFSACLRALGHVLVRRKSFALCRAFLARLQRRCRRA